MLAPVYDRYLWFGMLTYAVGVLVFAVGVASRSNALGAISTVLAALGAVAVCLHAVARVPSRPAPEAWTARRRPLRTSIGSLDELRHLPLAIQCVLADAQRIRRMFHARPFQPRGHTLWLIWEWQGRLRREADDLEHRLQESGARISRIDDALARLFDPHGSAWQSALLELDDALWQFIEAFARHRHVYR